MFSTVGTAWRLVVRRAAGDRPVLLAAFLTVLLSTTLLAAGPLYASATATAGLRQALADTPVPDANVTVTARPTGDGYAALDRAVGEAAAAALRVTGGEVLRTAESRSFALPGDAVALTRLSYLEGVEQRSRLVSGTWPRAGGNGAVEAALSTAAATELGLAAGDVVELRSRERDGALVTVTVSGTFAPLEPSAPAWFADPLVRDGVDRSGTDPSYGPFVVPLATVQAVSPGPFAAGWRLFPDFDRLTAEGSPALRRAVERLGEGVAGGQRVSVGTRLPELLRAAERSLLVTRSGVLIPTLQLTVLAVYALLFIAALLVGRRRPQSAVLAARGAPAALVLTAALLEGALLAVPAVAAGPWLASGAVRLLGRIGPLAALGLRLDPVVSPQAYGVAALAAPAAVLTLALPAVAWRSAPQSGTGARAPRRGLIQRAGIDVLLLAAATLAYLQLRRAGAPVVEGLRGGLGLDPLLVAAPALVLLAGALLGLRLVPLAARGAQWLGARGLGVVAPLGTRELARRPLRHARAALLLTLALAIGLFALGYGETWLGSQQDRADYDVGADLRLLPDQRPSAPSPLALRDALGRLAGIEAALPVLRTSAPVAPVRGRVEVLALDAGRADVVAFRPDLADRPIAQLLEPLVRERTPASLALPPGTVRLEMTASMTATDGLTSSVLAVVRDIAGLDHEVALGDLPADGAPHRLTAELGGEAQSLEQLRLQTPMPAEAVSATFTLNALDALDGRASAQPLGLPAGPDWETARAVSAFADRLPSTGRVTLGQGALLVLPFSTGAAPYQEISATFAVPARDPADVPLPALATERFLTESGARVGDEVTAQIGGDRRTLLVTGVVRAFPTLDPAVPGLVLDLPTLAAWEADAGAAVPEPGEWWIGVDGQAADVGAALRAPPLSGRELFDRVERARAQSTDPVALGLLGILLLGFVAAAVFAVIGVAVSTVSSARERTTEFGVVRALGLPPRQVRSWLLLESGLVLGAGVVGGTGLGLLLARLVLPSVTLTQEGEAVAPPVLVIVPVGPALLLGLVLAAALGAVVAVQAALLQRVPPAAVLRIGDER